MPATGPQVSQQPSAIQAMAKQHACSTGRLFTRHLLAFNAQWLLQMAAARGSI